MLTLNYPMYAYMTDEKSYVCHTIRPIDEVYQSWMVVLICHDTGPEVSSLIADRLMIHQESLFRYKDCS